MLRKSQQSQFGTSISSVTSTIKAKWLIMDSLVKLVVTQNNKREAGASLLFQPKLLLLMKTNSNCLESNFRPKSSTDSVNQMLLKRELNLCSIYLILF